MYLIALFLNHGGRHAQVNQVLLLSGLQQHLCGIPTMTA